MDNNQVSPQTCVPKMQLKCETCQWRVKKVLKKIHGMHSISIDANEETVVVSSTVDPHLFIAKLAKSGKKAELLWDPIETPRRNQNPHVEQLFKKPQNENASSPQSQPPAPAGGSPQAITFEHADHAQLQELAKIKGLKHIELRHSENIKLTFKDHNNDMSHVYLES